MTLTSGDITGLSDPSQFAGYLGEVAAPKQILLKKNNLHTEILIDPATALGSEDAAHISDVWAESAITTVMDCEDSVAAVDAEDKVVIYRNWLGLMKGDLTKEAAKGGKTFTRELNLDLDYTVPDGSTCELKCRSLMLVRNVGHLIANPAVLERRQ